MRILGRLEPTSGSDVAGILGLDFIGLGGAHFLCKDFAYDVLLRVGALDSPAL